MGIHINKLVSALVFMLFHCIFFIFYFFQVNPENTQKASTSRQLKECPVPFGCVWPLFSGQSKKGFFFSLSKAFVPEC